MTKVISPSLLRKQVEEGKKIHELVEYYDLPVLQMRKALKALDLKIRKFHAPKFVFEETDLESQELVFESSTKLKKNVEEVQEEIQEEVALPNYSII